MKIGIIYDAVFPYVAGGAEHRNYILAGIFSREHDVALYGLEYWKHDVSGCLPACRYIGVAPPVPLYGPDGMRRIREALYFAARLVKPLFSSVDDVWDVSSFPYFSVVTARCVSLVRRRPMVVTWYEYWGTYWYEYLGWRGIAGRAVETIALWCSPRIIAISGRTRDRIVAAGYPQHLVTVVMPGVDVQRIGRSERRREHFDLAYVGRLVKHKQVDLLVGAVAHLRRSGRPVTAVIVGDGPERERLAGLASELGVSDDVKFVGRVQTQEEVYSYLKSSRVFVCPSRREGFGLALVEAWACGIPAVVCDEPLSALPDLVDTPVKGRVVGARAAAIAAACGELLAEDPVGRVASLQETARLFDWGRCAEGVERIYKASIEAMTPLATPCPPVENGKPPSR